MIDYLALMGDTSDNIPGGPGVGPKTAAKWLAEHGSLEGVMAFAPKMPGKAGDNLRASLATLPLSRQLATIKCDVALEIGIDALVPTPSAVESLRDLYTTYEFRAWLDELPGAARPSRTVSLCL
jgi:DNA polymerase-1